MNILVTGGAGYIGSHFVKKISEDLGNNIIIVDNFSQSRNNVISKNNISYEEIDLRDREKLIECFKKNKIDIVVHYAALASVPDSVKNPQNYYQNNVVGGLNLLDAMLLTGVNKIVCSSSASVFGEPICELISEDHPKVPINSYGYTKLVFENILKHYHDAYNLNSISFRYFCASGCDESGQLGEFHMPETHIIPCLLETVLGKRDKFYVYGNDFNTLDGSGVRDYIHVNDIANAHVKAIEKLFRQDNVCDFYNLGINKGFSVMELITATEKVTGKKVNYEISAKRSGDPSKLIADANKARIDLGWEPEYDDLERIISSAYNFFRKYHI